MEMMRAIRRHHLERRKAWAVRVWRGWELWTRKKATPSAKVAGILANHPRRCSGPCCGNQRRHFGMLTRQERIARLPVD